MHSRHARGQVDVDQDQQEHQIERGIERGPENLKRRDGRVQHGANDDQPAQRRASPGGHRHIQPQPQPPKMLGQPQRIREQPQAREHVAGQPNGLGHRGQRRRRAGP